MPLTKLQAEIFSIIAGNRDPESYVAGSTPLNINQARFSGDIDIFHDREEGVAKSALKDFESLQNAGFELNWLRQQPLIYSAEVAKRGRQGIQRAATKLEWVADSDYRFFPVLNDPVFGYVLHPVDLALNKVGAAAGRRAIRDLVDTVTVHEHVLPLGALIWASVEKSPGFTPEGLIDEIRRNSRYHLREWEALESETPIDPADVLERLREALESAETFVREMPSTHWGLLFLKDGKVVQPDPKRLGEYETHAGRRRGHWPSSSEIGSAMLEYYRTGKIEVVEDSEAPPSPPKP
jgi:hypothetical protein